MKIAPLPFTVTDWSTVPATEHPGESGMALWRTLTIGDIRIRQVEYSPGYVADHWCDRGHILYVLEGELVPPHRLRTLLADGANFETWSSFLIDTLDELIPKPLPALS